MTPLTAPEAAALIDTAIEEYKLEAVYALFSGGHDSLTNAHVCSSHPAFAGVIHIDTGTGIPATRQFVEETCERYHWPLIVKSPVITYEMLIIKYGFPGPAAHSHMYRYLKERPLREAVKGLGRIGLLTGVRTQESQRRMGHVEPIKKDGGKVWIAPIHAWSKLDCNRYLKENEVPRNPVVDTLHMSGECFCGAYVRPNEKREIGFWYPEQYDRIERWEQLVRAATDLELAKLTDSQCRWGNGNGIPDEQLELFPMCQFCRSNGDVKE